jgi:hypothetical protein
MITIFRDFHQKIGVFLTNQCYILSTLCKIQLCVKNANLFADFFGEFFLNRKTGPGIASGKETKNIKTT